jgi:hypothetical protein
VKERRKGAKERKGGGRKDGKEGGNRWREVSKEEKAEEEIQEGQKEERKARQ